MESWHPANALTPALHLSITPLGRQRDAGGNQRLTVINMTMKQPCPIFEEVPDNTDIDDQDDQDQLGKMMGKLVYLDRNEERRFPNGQPAGPANSVHQANAFDQPEDTV